MTQVELPDYIVIEGNIGAGKTSLSHMLAQDINARLVLEQFADNPFLPKFYEDPKRYSFALELSFLAERYQQLEHDLKDRSLFQNIIISDYYFMKSLIFAQQTLEQDEYFLYRKLFDIIYASLPKPKLYVYLHVPVERLLSNIKTRGREYEQHISATYLQTVQDGYFTYFKQHQDQFPFLVIDTSRIDFVRDKESYEQLKQLILAHEYPVGITRCSM